MSAVVLLCLLLASPAAAGVEETCRQVGGKLGSVSVGDCLDLRLQPSGYHSVAGMPLLVREFPPRPDIRPLARILVLGGIHGDEYSSISIVFKWMNLLSRRNDGRFHWLFVPLLNPDGLLIRPSRRGNARNIDLNRNFTPVGDPGSSLRYWEERTGRDPRRYPGPYPMSEPETVFVARLIEEFHPDLIISVHAPYGLLDFDGPADAPQKLGRLHLHLLGTYPGSLGNYAGLQLNIPVVTIELPSAGRLPPAQEIGAIWRDLGNWLERNLPGKSLLRYSRLRP